MKLEYSLLVIDDDRAAAQTTIEGAVGFLGDEGFTAHWELLSSGEAVNVYLRKGERHRPDVVLVDNQLGEAFGSGEGNDWASRVRQEFPVTDILFYGQRDVKELRRKIADASVDGVFCATRREVPSRLKQIIAVHLERWTDPGAMRGLAVALASEIDEALRDACLAAARASAPDARASVYKKIIESADTGGKERTEKFRKYAAGDNLESIVRDVSFSADHVLRALGYVARHTGGSDTAAVKALARSVRRDVLTPRNLLAHGSYNAQARAFESGNQRWECTVESCRDFRRALASYRRSLRKFANHAKETGRLSWDEAAVSDS